MNSKMERRSFLKIIGAGMLASGLPVGGAMGMAAKRPHVLLIHVDQHRLDCLGAYGCDDLKTPHIDALAAGGERFNNSFCPYPVCTPSRYSMLSGMWVHDHQGWGNNSTLKSSIATFPRVLKAAGYRTKSVGKMHFKPTYLDVGFEEMELSEQNGPGRWDDDYHRFLREHDQYDRNDMVDQLDEYRKQAPQGYWDSCGAMVSNLPEKYHSTTWVGDRSVETVKTWEAGKPSLLMAGFVKPHHPFDPPAPWHEMYDPAKLKLLPGWTEKCFDHDLKYNKGFFPHAELTEKMLRKAMAYYYATISQIDHHVGRMVEVLKEKGIYDDTMIIFTSDHGDYMGHHHMLLKNGLMYDSLSKVPLIIKWPGGLRAGTVTERMVSNVDLAPTICVTAGCEKPETMTGLNLRRKNAGRDIVCAEGGGGAQLMARTRKRKLILNVNKSREIELLYDLEKDPLELNNVAGEEAYREDLKALNEAVLEWRGEKPNENFQDMNAPVIQGPNVPKGLEHRPSIIEYYAKKMEG